VSVAAEEGRMTSRAAAPEEVQFERALRPKSFAEYVGQDQAVASLRVSVEAARQRSECVDHVLLYGPPGLGRRRWRASSRTKWGRTSSPPPDRRSSAAPT
jgi:transcriptional regulator with AAA-type ATPase domain